MHHLGAQVDIECSSMSLQLSSHVENVDKQVKASASASNKE